MLMEEAERIAREEHGSVKIAVISGVIIFILKYLLIIIHCIVIFKVGTRHYYRKLGY